MQDNLGTPTQDNFGENLEGTSQTEERWRNANDNVLNSNINNQLLNDGYEWQYGPTGLGLGRQYGLDPQYAQTNGWFTID